MNHKSSIEKTYWIINLVMLFLFGMQFMGFSKIVIVLWLGLVILIEFTRCRKGILDIPAILLGLGGISYFYISGNEIITSVIFGGLPVALYLAGKVWCMRAPSFCNADLNGKIVILTLTLGTFAGGLLEKYSRFFRFTEECYSGRYWFDFWDGGLRPATYYMFYAMMILGTAFWAFYIRKNQKLLGNCFVLFIAVELIFFAWVETRTPFLVIGLVMVIEFALFLWLNRKEKYVKPTLIVGGVLAGAGIITALAVWYGNIFNIQNSAFGLLLSQDGGILGNIRFKAQRNAIMQLFVYPMGGKQMDLAGLPFVHNVWLDIANTAGLIPFFLIIAYTIFTIVECAKLVISKDVPQEMKYLMTGIFIALHLDYSVEPVLDANMIFWAMGACISGMIKGYRICSKEVTYEKECTDR